MDIAGGRDSEGSDSSVKDKLLGDHGTGNDGETNPVGHYSRDMKAYEGNIKGSA